MNFYIKCIQLLCAAVALNFFTAIDSQAADHNDSPIVGGAARSYVDITDVFAFRTPGQNDRFTIVVGHFSPEVAATPALFRSDADYEIFIDTDGDFSADQTIHFTFGAPAANGSQPYTVDGLPAEPSTSSGTTSVLGVDRPVALITPGSARVFAGLGDDPFFFDLDGFKGFTSAPCIPAAGLRCPGTGSPVDFFLGRNIAAIAVEFDLTMLPNISSANAGTLRIWAKAFEIN